MVQHYTSLDDVNIRNTWLTIGSFDGVHLGHQRLILEMNHKARQADAKSVVLTFHPHPSVILKGKTGAFYLTTTSEKVKLLDALDVDFIITYPFTRELSQQTAQGFVVYLLEHLGFQQLWAGNDFALGKNREGDIKYLRHLGDELNYQVHVVDPISFNDQIISSSQVRKLLSEGRIEDANRFLGRSYEIEGKVIRGDGRGKSIGIPTANLMTGDEKLIPCVGVYACKAKIKDKFWPAAVNIGTRPTFESADRGMHVEAHILDYSGDLYSKQLTIEFVSRLRGEQKFHSVEELINQVHSDISKTRQILSVK
jgi:riboflavin kinase / FMN adenylyltransferase